MKRPAFQFYPGDWRRDTSLQACSIGARGLWIELMCIMHECDPYGTLSVNGAPMKASQVARIVGETERTIKALMKELEDAGVFSRDQDGILYSRRMVADERVRAARAAGGEGGKEHGAKGGEHGAKGGRPKKEKGENKTPQETPLASNSETPLKTPLSGSKEPPPSSSSSSSSSERTIQSDLSSSAVQDTARPADPPKAASLSHERYAEVQKRVEKLLDSPNLLVFGRIDAWLKSGADPELDIYPTLERLKPRWKGRNLDYFDDAVAEALASRTKPLAIGSSSSGTPAQPRFNPVEHIRNMAKERTGS